MTKPTRATRRQFLRGAGGFSLALPFDQTGPQWDNVHMPERVNPELRTHTVNVSFTAGLRARSPISTIWARPNSGSCSIVR